MDKVDEFHFLKLMDTNEPLRVFTIRAGFSTKAGGMRHIPNGKLLRVEDLVSIEIRDGYFGRGNEKKIFCREMKGIIFEFR